MPSGVDSYNDVAVITPADGSDIPFGPCVAIMATVAGNVALVTAAERNKANMRTGYTALSVVIPVAAGQVIPIKVARVLATGTTATGLVGFN